MASGTILSRVLGFARAVILAAAIGVTTNAADAFGVANQLPNNVYAIIVGGVLNAVLVPQIVKARAHKDGGKGYIDRLLTFILTIFFAVSVLSTVAAPVLVAIYTKDWSGPQLALATAFAYWCLPQLFFYGLYSLLGEVLNARSAFGPFMWAPVLNNIVGQDRSACRFGDPWSGISGTHFVICLEANRPEVESQLQVARIWSRPGSEGRIVVAWHGRRYPNRRASADNRGIEHHSFT
jgi:hypothetical protein